MPARRLDDEIRAFADEALAQSKAGKPLIDVRSPGEYKGTITHMPEYPQEGVLRGGHIPGAKSVPWKTAVNDDGTFQDPAELAKIYTENCGLRKDEEIIAYCRIGERSSHTWFVLTYLLGYPRRPQLRRLLDGVGEPGAHAHRALGLNRPAQARPTCTYTFTFHLHSDVNPLRSQRCK